MKIIFIFSCSGMFRHVPECSLFRVLSTLHGLASHGNLSSWHRLVNKNGRLIKNTNGKIPKLCLKNLKEKNVHN